MKEDDEFIVSLIADILDNPDDESAKKKAKKGVADLCRAFPLYPELG